ncbi:phasin family protein [Elioraea sp. Yellowstone]|jgi:phasin family protein|uniref:phasin family protein n=1 Tax=Elioraea sp. Yellowstone TaxID=2592070 RepID=UPI001150085D|nr:phasin family protein [Elioraea sp. Yellowstone]TQF76518.1 phasin family protein [Elioraea sp. Yellowstone]
MTTRTKATATVVDTAAEAAQNGFEQAQAAFKAQFDEAAKHAAVAQKGLEQAFELGKGHVEALIKSSTIWAEGVQELAKAALAANQAAFEEGIANARALAAVKSVREAVELQTGFAKAVFEKFVAETTKLSEQGTKLAERAFAPVAERVNVTVASFGKPLAA